MTDDFVIERPVRYEATDDATEDDGADGPGDLARVTFSDGESELIAQRLQALGYIQ
jgi:hypothetical protein